MKVLQSRIQWSGKRKLVVGLLVLLGLGLVVPWPVYVDYCPVTKVGFVKPDGKDCSLPFQSTWQWREPLVLVFVKRDFWFGMAERWGYWLGFSFVFVFGIGLLFLLGAKHLDFLRVFLTKKQIPLTEFTIRLRILGLILMLVPIIVFLVIKYISL